MKKLVTLMLLSVLVLSSFATVASASSAGLTQMTGTIVSETENTIEVKPSNSDGGSVILNVDTSTYVVDCVTGIATPLKDRTNDKVSVYYGPVMTFSFPPKSNAVTIIVNVPDDAIPPRYAVAEAIDKADDEVRVTVDGGSLIVKIKRDNPISPYLTRNIVTIDNIEVGSKLLMWYGFVAESFPAQATSEKTVILGRGEGAAQGEASEEAQQIVDEIKELVKRLKEILNAN
ncbi:MAG: hypothetical protein LBS21_01860 [Clostridiales bacterium]|jgi:hypothetical protein|nr:hypothetical protein [Clostridiales bacterium]